MKQALKWERREERRREERRREERGERREEGVGRERIARRD
jgi:hypothetical protein